MKQDQLLMEHPEIEKRATSTRTAFDEVWADKGWVEIDPESGEPVKPVVAVNVTADADADGADKPRTSSPKQEK